MAKPFGWAFRCMTKITLAHDPPLETWLRTDDNLRQNCASVKVLVLLIAVSLVVALGFLAAFIWATRNGQFDDDQTPALRILHDNTTQAKSN